MKLGDWTTSISIILAACLSFALNSIFPASASEFSFINIWFDSDIARVMQNMTVREAGHGSTYKHPIFSLIVYFPTRLAILAGASKGTAIGLILGANAAIFIFAIDRLINLLGLGQLDRLAANLFCIGSSGFIFWFGVPETFPFGATSILLALLVLAMGMQRGHSLNWKYWAISTVIVTSITITNFLLIMSSIFIICIRSNFLACPWREMLKGVVVGFFTLAILALLQDQIFGEAGLFFNVLSLAGETRFFASAGDTGSADRLQTILLQSIVAGEVTSPNELTLNKQGVADGTLILDGQWPRRFVSWVGICLWGSLIGIAVLNYIVLACRIPDIILVAILFLFTNIGLHLIYGATVFLYSAHFLGPILLIVLWGSRNFFLVMGTNRLIYPLILAICISVILPANLAVYFTSIDIAEALHIEMLDRSYHHSDFNQK